MPDNLEQKGVMSVAVKTERGYTLSRQYGFTIEEENGHILAFDLWDHPQLGMALLFGNQVFALKYWSEENLKQGLAAFTEAVEKELAKRQAK